MPVLEKLRDLLQTNQVPFTQTTHPTAFTAREVASAEHLPAREVAKTVVIFGDGRFHMIVIPANRVVDLQEVRLALGLTHVRLATEDELAKLFPDCELGAMPPFGSLYGMAVYFDGSLNGDDTIAFNAGTHRDVVHMRTEDYLRLAQPAVVTLARTMAMRHGW
ncbi:MAG: YbaK/EbsC family protein [Acidobacteriia bacterium]|nr:YbaK/EbsC family protein [Terriglobia bacterium]